MLADLEAFFGVTGFFVVMARLARRLGGKYTGEWSAFLAGSEQLVCHAG